LYNIAASCRRVVGVRRLMETIDGRRRRRRASQIRRRIVHHHRLLLLYRRGLHLLLAHTHRAAVVVVHLMVRGGLVIHVVHRRVLLVVNVYVRAQAVFILEHLAAHATTGRIVFVAVPDAHVLQQVRLVGDHFLTQRTRPTTQTVCKTTK